MIEPNGPPPRASDAAEPGSEYVRWVQSTLNWVMNLRLPVDGIMGPETRSAIRGFQRREELPVDGIAGPETKQALIAARKRLSSAAEEFEAFDTEFTGEIWEGEVNHRSRDYIRWVQQALNRILGLRLTVDGIIGAQTCSAIRTFQECYGLTVDGIVGPQTERALIAAGAGQPPQTTTSTPARGTNVSVNTPLSQNGPGFYSYVSSGRRYGQVQTIQALQAIGRAWQQTHSSGPRIGIGDISFLGGGEMPPHKSHQTGLDVDIRPMRSDGREGPVRYQDAAYSRVLTQELVDRIINNGILHVQYILFNDPNVRSVRRQPGHDNHLHIRFYPPSASSSNPEYDCVKGKHWRSGLF